MAKSQAAKNSADKKEPKPGKKKTSGLNGSEPLSNFQTPATGRVQPPEPVSKSHNGKIIVTLEKASMQKNNNLLVSFSKMENDGSISNHPGETYDRIIHPDLKACFNSLDVHWGFLSTFLSVKGYKNIDSIDAAITKNFKCTGVIIKPEEAVMLIGHKLTDDGKAVNLNTPYRKFEEDDKNAYKFMENLTTVLERLTSEVLQYIDGTKKGEEPQLKLELPEQENEYDFEEDK